MSKRIEASRLARGRGTGTGQGTGNGSGAQLQSAAVVRWWLPPLPVRLVRFQDVYQALAIQYADDLGGEEELTTAQKIALWRLMRLIVKAEMKSRNIETRGISRKDPHAHDPLAGYIALENSIGRYLDRLGLERRAREVERDLRATWAEAGADGPQEGSRPAPDTRPSPPPGSRGGARRPRPREVSL